jgi:hypothetical protein
MKKLLGAMVLCVSMVAFGQAPADKMAGDAKPAGDKAAETGDKMGSDTKSTAQKSHKKAKSSSHKSSSAKATGDAMTK